MNEERYFLDRDDSDHWFLVLASKRKEWEVWRDILSHDPMERKFLWADRLDGAPSSVTFEKPTANLVNR